MNNPSSSATSSSQSHPPGTFFGGGNQLIQGGQFVQHNHTQAPTVPVHVCAEADDGQKHLRFHVATTAFDAKDKVDAPKCHPNTRIAVLNEIMAWIQELAIMRVLWIMWLNGAAGAGKSAIGRSVIELCKALNIPLVAFFFFRSDSTRNTIDSIVATIVYQLIFAIPDLEQSIVPRITRDPLIFTKSLETQFNTLVFEPLRQLHETSVLPKTLVLLFDGVDELSGDENQIALIELLSNFVESKVAPVVVFFASRTESQIKQAFASQNVSRILKPLPLDNNYLPDSDICLFLNDSFSKIKATHSLKQFLKPEWPGREHVDEIVKKSSGQFIYASVVVKFISTPRAHPAKQLDIIRGLKPAGALTPFAQLDALYRHIFSQVQDLDGTLFLLAARIIGGHSFLNDLRRYHPSYFPSKSSIICLLIPLSPVICYDGETIEFLHASLPDFLLDHARSREYFIDIHSWSTTLAISITAGGTTGIANLLELLKHAVPTEALRKKLASLKPSANFDFITAGSMIYFLSDIQRLDFNDGGELFLLVLKKCTIASLIAPGQNWWGTNNSAKFLPALEEKYDISQILKEIEDDPTLLSTYGQVKTVNKDLEDLSVEEESGEEDLEDSSVEEESEEEDLEDSSGEESSVDEDLEDSSVEGESAEEDLEASLLDKESAENNPEDSPLDKESAGKDLEDPPLENESAEQDLEDSVSHSAVEEQATSHSADGATNLTPQLEAHAPTQLGTSGTHPRLSRWAWVKGKGKVLLRKLHIL